MGCTTTNPGLPGAGRWAYPWNPWPPRQAWARGGVGLERGDGAIGGWHRRKPPRLAQLGAWGVTMEQGSRPCVGSVAHQFRFMPPGRASGQAYRQVKQPLVKDGGRWTAGQDRVNHGELPSYRSVAHRWTRFRPRAPLRLNRGNVDSRR